MAFDPPPTQAIKKSGSFFSTFNICSLASFPITDKDQLMLVTDKGKLIRCPVNDIRIAGRQTQGVTLFNVSDDERVVSVAKLEENE